MRKWFKRIGAAFGILIAAALAVLAVAMSHDSSCGSPSALTEGGTTMKAVTRRCYGPPIDPGSIAGLIETQAEGQRLASELIGSDVADGTGEAVGAVTDLILDDENQVIGAVISTGGFLGIGKHEVGVDIAQLQRDPAWDLYVIAWSREEIEAAPAFLTLAEQEAEREAELLRQQQMQQLEQQQAPADPSQLQQ
jgi:sporulation protein YlmC with PRC-barrel domain